MKLLPLPFWAPTFVLKGIMLVCHNSVLPPPGPIMAACWLKWLQFPDACNNLRIQRATGKNYAQVRPLLVQPPSQLSVWSLTSALPSICLAVIWKKKHDYLVKGRAKICKLRPWRCFRMSCRICIGNGTTYRIKIHTKFRFPLSKGLKHLNENVRRNRFLTCFLNLKNMFYQNLPEMWPYRR